MLSTAERDGVDPDAPAGPRLRMQPDHPSPALLDGGCGPDRMTRPRNCPG